MVWPDSADKLLEVELAQEVLKSELLVSEDEDFISNFILTEEALEEHRKLQVIPPTSYFWSGSNFSCPSSYLSCSRL